VPINSLFLFKASAVSVSQVSLGIDDPTSSEISKAYSIIKTAVDDQDILVWNLRLGHHPLPAFNWLLKAGSGI
jgi:hypothetical protein